MSFSLQHLFGLDRKLRIYLRFIIETVVIITVYAFCMAISDIEGEHSSPIYVFNAIIWIFAYKSLGLHKDRLRFSSLTSYLPILKISLFLALLLAIESVAFTGTFDLNLPLVFALLSLNTLVGFRVLARQIIRREASATRENILVYGTSDIAIDLVNAMAFGKKYNVVGFISDNPQSIGSIAGIPVISFRNVEHYAHVNACKLVVLASDSLYPERQAEVLQKLDKLCLSVSYAPTIDRAFDYEIRLKSVNPEVVLGRSGEIQLDPCVQADLNKTTILVTGAGGSIGSEICRQILRYQPERLIVLELNEFALYTLEHEISEFLEKSGLRTQVNYYLGSVVHEAVLSRIFTEHSINIVYHAAAYKHVPILESNVVSGVINNVLGTKCLADYAHRFGVDKFVLVSTDKAVRPTNVMGATKRLAELVIQDLSKSSATVFTMVRFGNVLGSSGSVIPKFKAQINAGGPVTVTHEEITRYFMSIPEAAHLVLSAGTLASGGDVFLLDMGDPVKIVELAKSMVRQHGLQPVLVSEIAKRLKRNNEIVIEFSGLRLGEKLYEELLVDGVAQETQNPKIFKSHDSVPEGLDLAKALRLLEKNVKDGDTQAILAQLHELPLSFQPNSASEIKKMGDDNVDKAKTEIREVSVTKNTSCNLVADQEYPSLLKRAVSSKFGLALLHLYFLWSRGLTLGVRVFVQNSKGEVLLVKHSYVTGWHLPGGGVDIAEDVKQAAKREVLEETGVRGLENLTFLGIDFNETISNRDHVVYLIAFAKTDIIRQTSAEIIDAQFVPKEKLVDVLVPSQWEFIQDKV